MSKFVAIADYENEIVSLTAERKRLRAALEEIGRMEWLDTIQQWQRILDLKEVARRALENSK